VESELRDYLDASEVFLFSSGRAGLTVLLRSLARTRPERRVVIPAYTCYSVPAAVVRAGLEPVLVDVDPSTLDFDETSLRHALDGDGVLCVIPTHLFGVAADVARLRERCRDGVFIVEDAAQALGVPGPDGRPLGTLGDAAVFSLGRGKHVTCGSGGVVVVRSASLGGHCRDLHRGLGAAGAIGGFRLWIEMAVMSMLIDPRLYWVPAGLPFLGLGRTVYSTDYAVTDLSPVAVGALRHWRERLEAANAKREETVRLLGRAIPVAPPRSGPLLRYPVLLPSPEGLHQFVTEGKALGVTRMYPTAVHQIPELRARFAGIRFPGAERLAAGLATIPTHQFVRPADIDELHSLYERAVGRMAVTREALSTC
jgi:dTDP-4-amino-4,6-dideoxygalactose transaminase